MRLALLVAVTFSSAVAFAQAQEPSPEPTPQPSPEASPAPSPEPSPAPAIAKPPAVNRHHAGFFLGFETGYAEAVGSLYEGDVSYGRPVDIQFGWRFNERIAVETSYFLSRHEVKETGGRRALAIGMLSVGARGFHPLTPKAEATLYLGAGSGRLDSTSASYSGREVEAAIGARYHPIDVLFVSAELGYAIVRYQNAVIEDESGDLPTQEHGDVLWFVIGGGLQF